MFAKEGWYFVFTAFVLALLSFLIPSIDSINYLFHALPFLILMGFFVYFFRDPKRIPELENGILSPADGLISAIEDNGDSYSFYVEMHLSNVHVQRAPIDGTVISVQRVHGDHHKIYFIKKNGSNGDVAIQKNARAIIQIENDTGEKYEVIQICGALARRAKPYVNIGDSVQKGERLGIIMFGSLVKFTYPKKNYTINVAIGDKVKAGHTVLLM